MSHLFSRPPPPPRPTANPPSTSNKTNETHPTPTKRTNIDETQQANARGDTRAANEYEALAVTTMAAIRERVAEHVGDQLDEGWQLERQSRRRGIAVHTLSDQSATSYVYCVSLWIRAILSCNEAHWRCHTAPHRIPSDLLYS